MLIDTLPLADPSEGVKGNTTYFLRSYYTYLVLTFLAIHQFHISVPALPYPVKRIIGNTLVVATCTVGIVYKLSSSIGFPLPFSVLTVTPPWLLLIVITLVIEWAKKVRKTPGAAAMLITSIKLWMCQVLLVVTYPSYFYVFTTLSKEGKTAFAMLLPLLKLFMKNLFARTVVHLRDEMPEIVVFNAELFNALFVSYCMQNLQSIWITMEIMIVDIVMMVFSLRGAVSARRSLKDMERRIGQQSSWDSFCYPRNSCTKFSRSRLTTLDRASMLLFLEPKHEVSTLLPPARLNQVMLAGGDPPGQIEYDRKVTTTSIASQTKTSPNAFRSVRHPIRMVKALVGGGQVYPALEADPNGANLSESYTRKVQSLVYAAEFLLLLNYVEVIVPLVFSIYLFATYHLPNHDYYAQLHGMDRDHLIHTLQSVLFYCLLQLVSLLVLFVALQQLLGLSPVHQLAYVLEKRYSGVQLKLVFWVYYNAQASLQHSGYDYSFQFPWLHAQNDSISVGSE